ncbi:MAG: hypothetical protein ACT4PX_05545 [Actinomycetota bacterium]
MTGARPAPPRVAPGAWLAAAGAVAARPHLWPTAVRQAALLAPPGWWRRRPFLPLPDPGYLAFRLETMYGGEAPAPHAGDVVAYLRWCRSYRRSLR